MGKDSCGWCDYFYVDVNDSQYGCIIGENISKVRSGEFKTLYAKYRNLGNIGTPIKDEEKSLSYSQIQDKIRSGEFDHNDVLDFIGKASRSMGISIRTIWEISSKSDMQSP